MTKFEELKARAKEAIDRYNAEQEAKKIKLDIQAGAKERLLKQKGK